VDWQQEFFLACVYISAEKDKKKLKRRISVILSALVCPVIYNFGILPHANDICWMCGQNSMPMPNY